MRRDDSNVDVDAALTPIQAAVAAGGQRGRTGAVPNLGLTITNPPTQAEVQAISNKVDELLAALRTSGQLTT